MSEGIKKQMKPKLLILSDIFGFDNSPWIKNYVELLESDFQLTFYDSCKLARINRSNLTEMKLHTQFINGGIDNAVNELLKLENKNITVLAFSIGGTIAWKAELKGFKINRLYAVSSNRLRYETKRPNCFIHLVYGENDTFKPESTWFEKLNLETEIIENGQHEIYKNKEVINNLCDRIKLSQ